jgi:uncharacterized heparinase superfamily protein
MAYRLRRLLPAVAVPSDAAGAWRAPKARWQEPVAKERSYLGGCRFRLLGHEAQAVFKTSWTAPNMPTLWCHHLHYFEDLLAKDGAQRREEQAHLVASWIRDNAPTRGEGWRAYPVSVRIANWTKWMLAGDWVTPETVRSLCQQACWLQRNLEFETLGNHLLANAKALLFAGCCVHSVAATGWLLKGKQLFERELREQVLEDGGHIERSPMYHSLVLEDLLDVLNLAGAYPDVFTPGWVCEAKRTAGRMLDWLEQMSHPDGRIALFNDSNHTNEVEHRVLRSYAERLGIEIPKGSSGPRLENSGFARLEAGQQVVFFDAGPIGAEYIPAHAHADTLSLEVSSAGRRLIVDSGVSTYEEGSERQEQRGTAAHNTIVVDSENQSEVWGAFRVGRRARPLDPRCGSTVGCLWAEAGHDGYHRLSNPVTHRRRVELRAGQLIITDRLDGRGPHNADLLLHLHPDIRARAEDNIVRLATADGQRVATVRLAPALNARIEGATYHPRFLASEKSNRIRATWNGALPAEWTTEVVFH